MGKPSRKCTYILHFQWHPGAENSHMWNKNIYVQFGLFSLIVGKGSNTFPEQAWALKTSWGNVNIQQLFFFIDLRMRKATIERKVLYINSTTSVLETTEPEIYIFMYNYEIIPSYQGCELEQSTRGREFQQHDQMSLGKRQCGDDGKAGPPPAQAQVVGNHPMPMGTSAWVSSPTGSFLIGDNYV